MDKWIDEYLIDEQMNLGITYYKEDFAYEYQDELTNQTKQYHYMNFIHGIKGTNRINNSHDLV